MNNLSFEITTSEAFFKGLLDDYNDFLRDKISSRKALTCAIKSWHLAEWIYYENEDLQKKYTNVKESQNSFKALCPSLKIMQDIANGAKHYKLCYKSKVRKTEKKKGSFDNSFDRSFDISRLIITLKNGKALHFEDEIKNVIDFWKSYLDFNLIDSPKN